MQEKNNATFIFCLQIENFSLEFVNNKPWSGYNGTKGAIISVIQINTDLNIFIDRAIDGKKSRTSCV